MKEALIALVSLAGVIGIRIAWGILFVEAAQAGSQSSQIAAGFFQIAAKASSLSAIGAA